MATNTTLEHKRKRPRGSGGLYHVKGSRYWWISYSLGGRLVRESSHCEKKVDAIEFLKKRLAAVQSGNFVGPEIDRILVEELAQTLLADYRINGKCYDWAETNWRLHVGPFFGKMRASVVGTDSLNAYIEERRAEKAENATINRELSLLQRMFTLGYEAQPAKVARLLRFHRLAENPPRTGFVTDEQYHQLCVEAREPWLRLLLCLAFNYGFRKGELLGMRVRQVDLIDRILRLEVGTTKNGEGRTVKLTNEAYLLLMEAVRGKQPDDYLLTRPHGGPVRDLRGTWAALVEAAKMPGLLLHDMKRSAVRRMVRAGVPERVAMAISGHRTRSVFDRYNIVSESDLADAAANRIEIQRQFIVAPKHGNEEVAENAVKPS